MLCGAEQTGSKVKQEKEKLPVLCKKDKVMAEEKEESREKVEVEEAGGGCERKRRRSRRSK